MALRIFNYGLLAILLIVGIVALIECFRILRNARLVSDRVEKVTNVAKWAQTFVLVKNMFQSRRKPPPSK